MVTTLELQSPLPAPLVLDRIRADAEDWHESRLSPAARQRNLYGFALRVRGHRFWLRVRGGRQNAFAPVCDGEVHDSDSGSRIVARFRLPYLSVIAGVVWVAALVASPSPAQAPQFTDPSPKSASELIPALDHSIAKVKEVLGGMDDAALMATWRLMQGDRELLAVPRVAMLRSVMLNHWYHHRGQLTVYLRELGVPIPSIYGPSADENPFA